MYEIFYSRDLLVIYVKLLNMFVNVWTKLLIYRITTGSKSMYKEFIITNGSNNVVGTLNYG